MNVHVNARMPVHHPWCRVCGRLNEPGTSCAPQGTITFCSRCGRVATTKSAHGPEQLDITKACGDPTS